MLSEKVIKLGRGKRPIRATAPQNHPHLFNYLSHVKRKANLKGVLHDVIFSTTFCHSIYTYAQISHQQPAQKTARSEHCFILEQDCRNDGKWISLFSQFFKSYARRASLYCEQHVCVCVCVHTHTHTYIYTYTHTHTCIYTYTYMYIQGYS